MKSSANVLRGFLFCARARWGACARSTFRRAEILRKVCPDTIGAAFGKRALTSKEVQSFLAYAPAGILTLISSVVNSGSVPLSYWGVL